MTGIAEVPRRRRHRLRPSSPGEHDVENDEIEVGMIELFEKPRAVRRGFDGHVVTGEVGGEQFTDVRVVVNDEKACLVWHGLPPIPPGLPIRQRWPCRRMALSGAIRSCSICRQKERFLLDGTGDALSSARPEVRGSSAPPP